MKKILSLLSAALLISMVFVSCKSGESYALKMRLKQGDHFENNMLMNMTTSVSGMEVKMGMETGSAFDVLSSDAAEKKVKMTYTKAKMSMDMGDIGKMSGNNNTDSLMNSKTSQVVGKSITITLDKDNMVKDVDNKDNIFVDENMPEETRKMMEEMMSKDQLTSMWGMMFGMYPNDPVHIGDSWKKDLKLNFAGLEMVVKMKYTLKDVKNGIADIRVDGKIEGKGKMAKMPIDVDMSGTQNGNMFVKLSDGYVDQGNYKMEVSANMEMMGQKMPMKMKGDYIITGSK